MHSIPIIKARRTEALCIPAVICNEYIIRKSKENPKVTNKSIMDRYLITDFILQLKKQYTTMFVIVKNSVILKQPKCVKPQSIRYTIANTKYFRFKHS